MAEYTSDFYRHRSSGSAASARRIVPIVVDLLQPRSVIDVGCGTGSWLAVSKAHGIQEVLGVDGDYVPRDRLEIPAACFAPHDLRRPVAVDRRFDLVLCLEVAEHLPPESSGELVSSLCRLGSAVLFSAAIPHQGGTGHVNEQWPEYWARLFDQHAFEVLDCVRPAIWNDVDVDWWYAQNVLLFVDEPTLSSNARLSALKVSTRRSQLSVVHPRSWMAMQARTAAYEQALRSIGALATIAPEGSTLIVVDDNLLGTGWLPNRTVLPFIERDGEYWGPPANGAVAIRELERMRSDGAGYLVVFDVARWWLAEYDEFAQHLGTTYACVLQDSSVTVFSLAPREIERRSGGSC